MNRRALASTLRAVGVVVLLVALGADLVGLGNESSIGQAQMAGAVAGAALAAAGALLRLPA